MATFTAQGATLNYAESGRGEPLLLIHGLGSSGADWALQLPVLENRFRTIVPDLPGCGRSPAPAVYSIEGFADALWALLDHLGVPRVNIVGFSMGGAVALEMAVRRPAAVTRLGLINSLATYRLDVWRKWFEARVPAALVRLLGMKRAAAISAARLFPEPWQRPLRERAANVIGAVPAAAYLGLGMALQRWSIVDRLHVINSRVMLIAAENDFTSLEEKRALAARLRAQFVVVRGARHATPFDSIDATNACLTALLTDQPPPPGPWVRDAATHSQVAALAAAAAESGSLGVLGSIASG
jgi:pimeloyl-ACP methyl ester carboxylesterase